MRTSTCCNIPSPSRRRPAFSLIEAVVVMWAMSVILVVTVALLWGAFHIKQAATDAFDRRTKESLLADKFRADVARAAAAPESMDKLKAGPTCLILEMADGSHVVYRWDKDRFERAEQTGPGDFRWIPIGLDCAAVELTQTGTDRRLLTMRLREALDRGAGQRSLEIAAALGGDLR
jgi:hypothetical protein